LVFLPLLACGAEPDTTTYGISQYDVVRNQTHTIYTYDVEPQYQSTYVSYFWLTASYYGLGTESVGDLVWTVYVDGEFAYRFTAYQLIGVGFNDNTAPWGEGSFGRGSSVGGQYSHMKIPFLKSIRYDVALVPDAPANSILYWQIRLTHNRPIKVADFVLPAYAKLVQYSFDVTLQTLDFIKFVDTSNNGLVYMHFFQGSSLSPNFMEGCYRVYKQNSQTQNLLSTGFEDYYQSAYYFHAGPYHFPSAGCTHRDIKTHGEITEISGYKIHTTDPLFFTSGGFKLVWRNGDTMSNSTKLKCSDPNGPVVGKPASTDLIAHTWVYEW